MENLITKKARTIPSRGVCITAIQGEMVGVRLVDLHRAGWDYAAKVKAFSYNLISKDLVRAFPDENSRAFGSMDKDNDNHFISNRDRRVTHLRKISHSSKYEMDLRMFLRRIEVFGEGAYFLRAIGDIWEGGNKILRSIKTRIHDLRPADAHALDIFFTFHDVLVLTYYDSTASCQCADSCDRDEVKKMIERFYDTRQLMRMHQDELVATGVIAVAEKLRDRIMDIARTETCKVMTVVNLSRKWQSSLAGRITVVMMARSFTEERKEAISIAKARVGERFGLCRLSNLFRHLENLDKVSDTFAKAEIEYITLFSE